MGFNKNKGISTVAVLIILAIFNCAAFLLPMPKGIIFWIGYGFATLAALVFLATLIFLFDSEDKKQEFSRLPLVKLGWGYFILQMILSGLEIAGLIPMYLAALIINSCLIGFYVIVLLASKAAGESIEEQDKVVAEKIFFIKNMQLTLSSIKSEDKEITAKLQRLAEDFKFSDPMSHSMLSELENQIEAKIIMLKSEISDNEKANNSLDCIKDLLTERNQKCKHLKNVKEEKPKKDNSGVKYVGTTIGIFAAIGAIILVVCFAVVPSNKFKEGVALYDEGKYEAAIVVFEELNGFGKSDKMIEECKIAINQKIYDSAKQLFDTEKYEEALPIFEALKDFSDSEAMLSNCKNAINERDYTAAQTLLNEEKYMEAIKAYTALGDYKDSKQKIEQIQNRISDDDVLYYGSYNGKPIAWKVIRNENNKMLLISKDSICELPYHNQIKDVSWNESSLNKWLNEEFIKSFSTEQSEDIISTEIDNENCKVFLLSSTEATNIKSKLLKSDKDWWLRTEAKTGANAKYVTKSGTVSNSGDEVVRSKGVRPCIWIDLK